MSGSPSTGGTAPRVRWYLESLVEGASQLRRIVVLPLPFRVGRRSGLELTLASDAVSKDHAELYVEDGELRVRDLHSKNGTFVNSEPVQDAPLREGDILHFAQVEFRVGRKETKGPDESGREPTTASMGQKALPQQFVKGIRELPELLRERRVTSFFQPIVTLPSGAVAGYEALGRGRHPGLPEAPLDLFRIAEGVGAQAELSEVFRERALELTAGRRDLHGLFLNVHPAELERGALVPAMREARQRTPHLRLTLEIHEGALSDLSTIKDLRAQLGHSGVGLAYDDFGAGRARLLELAEVPPHFLKFDMSLVHGIQNAPPSRQRLLSSLVAVARDLLVYTVAQGVESPEEAEVCRRIGFTHAQGFHFGRPRPIEEL
jgi:EAL domain-containing protein (putative c-di-GMP-specific phosphodiesterase class I)